MSEMTADPNQVSAPKLPDHVRMRRAARYHGTRMLVYIAVFAALDAWVIATDGLLVAQLLSVIAAYITGSYLTGVFHEWGHFTGARVSGSRSPIVRKPKGIFMFGFDMEKNDSRQFLSMSLGGPIANWLLVLLVLVLMPLDTIGRIALLAVVFGRAVAVCLFELPVVKAVYEGGHPQTTLDARIDEGALDSSQVYGYLVMLFAFFALIILI